MTATLSLLNTIQAIGLLSCFALLGTSRIGACIRWLSLQGIVFGLVPLIAARRRAQPARVLLSGGNIALKGVVFPWLLLRIRARADFSREVDPSSATSPRSCSASCLGAVGMARPGDEAGARHAPVCDARSRRSS